MELNSDNTSTKHLGHLGILAATIQKLGLIEKIDSRLPLNKSKGGIVSHGTRVAAIILNGLGFVNSRLYMSQMFFHDKPISNLLGSEITADNLNDDALGRALDAISKYGTTKLFSEVILDVAKQEGLLSNTMHLDSTSLTLHGDYNNASDDKDGPTPTYGYSKAHRSDLKQVVLSIVQMGKSNLPIWMEDLSGNSSDKTIFHETVKKMESFYKDIEDAPEKMMFIVDAAFYNTSKLQEYENVNWITRIPAQPKQAKKILNQPHQSFDWCQCKDARYQITKVDSLLSSQRWIMAHSKPGAQKQYQTFCKKLTKSYEILNKQLWHISNNKFNNEDDALFAIKQATSNLRYFDVSHNIIKKAYYKGKGRPKNNVVADGEYYKITFTITSNLEKVRAKIDTLGRFMLGTNVISQEEISDEDILNQYKQQSSIEVGFKFIKNNAFQLDNVFLKSQSRIGALMMIMTLCLAVNNFTQYSLRELLDKHDEVLPNQLGKPIKNPTAQWVFTILSTIAVAEIILVDKKISIVTNMQPLHKKIISFFGPAANKIYDIPINLKPEDVVLNKKNWLAWCGM